MGWWWCVARECSLTCSQSARVNELLVLTDLGSVLSFGTYPGITLYGVGGVKSVFASTVGGWLASTGLPHVAPSSSLVVSKTEPLLSL